ncbi:MAG: hypothetical protein K2X52_09075 [Mycobacteriaceae bacterium]|nr:hypothetical protein [Mycobacteriaceae bacterium]
MTALAAEDMGNTDDDIAGHAYYARLAKLLGLPHDDARLRQQYSAHAEFLWRCLNSWLDDLDGERGIPTAYALTYRYVGLPMSQALVREGDRLKFPAVFAQLGLSPGMHMAPEDLVSYLDQWLGSEQSSASSNLRRLWSRPATRERIATVAAVELANWDGTITDDSVISAGGTSLATRAMVVANLRSGFMGESLSLSLGLRPLGNEMDGEMQVRSTSGAWIDIAFSPGTAGLWRTSYNQAVDFGSMLEGVVRIRHTDETDGTEYKRFPRTVIPLIYDELQSAFVESERLQIGTDSALLVRTRSAETKVKMNVVQEVERALASAARPGFKPLDSINGLPSGWVLFKDVQLFGEPKTHLNELIPLARNKLTIAGGLRIPSRIRKWSTLRPPEVRAAVQSEPNLRVTLSESTSEDVLFEWTSDSGALVAPLPDAKLGDGDYRVSLYTGGKKNPIQQSSIRLRSSNGVDTAWESAVRLVYDLTEPLGALSASELHDGIEKLVDGVTASGNAEVKVTCSAPTRITWNGRRQIVQPSTIQIGTPDPKSCVVTGAHYFVLPTFYGKSGAKFIEGVCKSCEMVKRFPAWPKSKWHKKSTNSEVLISTHELDAIDDETRPDWDAALDALMHLGGGSTNSLESIALQLDGSLLFVDSFIRTLEALGHIGVERDDQFKVGRWEISPACLAEATSGSHRLTGFWPPSQVVEVAHGLAQFGSELRTVVVNDGPSVTSFENVTCDGVAALEEANLPVSVTIDTGMEMLRALPPLSSVGETLQRVPMPGFQSAERFDLLTAAWTPSGDPYAPGAYRLRRGFESLYIFRSDKDIEAGTAAIAPVHLVKHLASNAAGGTLLVYAEKARAVFLPRGCDLPGLYGRAAVAMAGRPPIQKPINKGGSRICLFYREFERNAADLLVTLLST